MPRKADPDRKKSFEVYKKHNGNIELIEIAKQLKRPPGTIRGWKAKDQWDAKLNGAHQKKNMERSKRKERDVPQQNDKKILKELEDAELTEKQRLFCLYYIKNFNATMAAIKAGYSPDRAHVTGSELVRNSKVAAEIRRLKGAIQEELFIDATDVLNKYIQIAFADITDFVEFGQEEVPVMTAFGPATDKDGNIITKLVNVVKFRDVAQVDGGLIRQIKQGKDGASIKLEDRMKALDRLEKNFDLFPNNFQRKIEEEKLNIARQKLELEKLRADAGGEEEETDDGLMDALRNSVKEVWGNEE
jgi:phage terminase small subunit